METCSSQATRPSAPICCQSGSTGGHAIIRGAAGAGAGAAPGDAAGRGAAAGAGKAAPAAPGG